MVSLPHSVGPRRGLPRLLPRAAEPRAGGSEAARGRRAGRTTTRSRHSSGRLLRGSLISLLLLALAAIGPLQVMQTSETAATGYEIRDLERERADLTAQVRLLEVELASMVRVEEIEQAAVERLGMVHPESTLRLSVGVPAPEAPPLPERYVAEPTTEAPRAAPWWERLLGAVSALPAP